MTWLATKRRSQRFPRNSRVPRVGLGRRVTCTLRHARFFRRAVGRHHAQPRPPFGLTMPFSTLLGLSANLQTYLSILPTTRIDHSGMLRVHRGPAGCAVFSLADADGSHAAACWPVPIEPPRPPRVPIRIGPAWPILSPICPQKAFADRRASIHDLIELHATLGRPIIEFRHIFLLEANVLIAALFDDSLFHVVGLFARLSDEYPSRRRRPTLRA
jgi:hypothetical protein